MDASSHSRSRRPSAVAEAAALLAVLACLVPAAAAASRRAPLRTAPSAGSAALQDERMGNKEYSPSIIYPRMVLEVNESENERDGYAGGQDGETADDQNGMFGRLLATALSIPKSICKNMLNGVVSAIFGGAKTAGDDDAR
ncbi:uncharacterized protein LOC124162515 [Ischnura elegans]|uniref:uncharacterized protein LOC124162515 n=1 Tax=Ischnura elegans TaxID=197161 RepID=UPI001ED8675D|nr:uncharacterized protein LOC124162515 [Ischnura elegans]